MSLGLVIEDIAGSVRPAATGAAVEAGAVSAGKPTAANQPVSTLPVSGQAQLVPGFSVVVLQLLNEQGAVTSTIPTARQLAAYRDGTATPPG